MLLSVLLILVVALFAVGFLWPVMWFAAIALLVVWIGAMVSWGVSRRGRSSTTAGSRTLEDERPRHRVE
jgi:uncharacterized membrane protein